MNSLLNRIHARIGDLWWYSAMLFIACRSGDVIQAFIGLWLVPKYVGPNELGAVLPLQQLSSFFTVPLAIVAVVFSKYVNTYATRGERGKVKSFIHDVILVSAVLFLVCIAAAYFLIPHFYSRLNIAAGSLTILVLASGFVCNISNLFGSALQGLKKFKTMTVQSLISAPIRLVTLLVAMPFRPLSGYMLGQTTPSLATSTLALIDIHRDLKPFIPDHTWRKDIPEILKYLWPMAIYMSLGTLSSSIISTVYRQRLPEIESAAYYMLSRFSEVAGYLGATVTVVLFPLASEAHEQKRKTNTLLLRSITASLVPTALLALIFFFAAEPLFAHVPTWETYLPYAHLLPIMTITTGLISVVCAVSSYEIACKRFHVPALLLTSNIFLTSFLVAFTGYEFFRGILPDSFVELMKNARIATLSTLSYIGFAYIGLQALVSSITSYRLSNR